MDEVLISLRKAYDCLKRIYVADNAVDYMAVARQEIRKAYKAVSAQSAPAQEVQDGE